MAWTKIYKISIDESKCGTADSTNFPVLFTGTYAGGADTPDLRHTDHGGNVTSANGYDICFYSDSELTTLLDFERVAWAHDTGVSEFYVNIPTLSSSTNTEIYLGVGNAAIEADQQDMANTWNSYYKLVAHFAETSGTTVNDSSGSGNNGTATRTNVLNNAGGPVGYMGAFASATPDYVTLSDVSDFRPTSTMSICAWFKTNTNANQEIMSNFEMTTQALGWQLYAAITSQVLYFSAYTSVGVAYYEYTGTDIVDDAWHRVIATYDGSDMIFYIAGVAVATTAVGTPGNIAYGVTQHPRIGCRNYSADGQLPFNGNLDEVYFMNGVAVSASWAAADYNNQNSPSTFYAITDVTPASGTKTQINIGDTWKTVSAIKINIGDAWKTVSSIKQNIGDAWKTVF